MRCVLDEALPSGQGTAAQRTAWAGTRGLLKTFVYNMSEEDCVADNHWYLETFVV